MMTILFEIGLSIFIFTSLPTNYIRQRSVAIFFVLLVLLSVLAKSKSMNLLISKIMLSAAIIGSLIQLFI
ncbi:hypothetical protein SAMN04488700_1044 [Carnobacterium iners]|uniref:Uncharacterized protein n=1 Tax=Carnobacterium iners TaxID=1073423 RepID=A0A1X7MWK4_9LACT|nr:hypothetical protein SAMN04488114_10133 [Carnobacterium iners]SMH29260.1 hypothetical protein SAMN04488700_1044 [Carnobacterium iners]